MTLLCIALQKQLYLPACLTVSLFIDLGFVPQMIKLWRERLIFQTTVKMQMCERSVDQDHETAFGFVLIG